MKFGWILFFLALPALSWSQGIGSGTAGAAMPSGLSVSPTQAPAEFGSLEALKEALIREIQQEVDTLLQYRQAVRDSLVLQAGQQTDSANSLIGSGTDSVQQLLSTPGQLQKEASPTELRKQLDSVKLFFEDPALSETTEAEAARGKVETVDELLDAYDQVNEGIAKGKNLQELGNLTDNEQVQKALAKADQVQNMIQEPNADLLAEADRFLGIKKNKLGQTAYVNPKKHPFIKGKQDQLFNNKSIDRPLGDRVTLGGNFHLNRREPVSFDISPLIGYELTNRWEAGLGFSFRYILGRKSAVTQYSGNTWGLRIYSRYDLLSIFFANLEVEGIRHAIIGQDGSKDIRWTPGVLVGMGARYPVFKGLKGNVTFTYNLSYNEADQLYNSPWQLKFGVDF